MDKYVKLIIDNSATSDSGDAATEIVFQTEARKRHYWRHKNDKTWWEKLILYIGGLKWIKIIRSLKWAH